MSYEAGELDRRLANIIRIGTIAALDESHALVKVKLDDQLTTTWLPWVTSRAGNTRTWSAPRVGEQVVLLAPSGELAQAVVLPAIYQDAFDQPATSKDQEKTIFPDGSTVDYNSATNTLTVTVAGSGNVIVNCKVATVVADTSVTLDTPNTFCTGKLTVADLLTYQNGIAGTGGTNNNVIQGDFTLAGGSVTHNGKNIGSTHTHGGIQPGGGNTAVPN